MTFRTGSRPHKEWGRFPSGEITQENNAPRNKTIAITVLALDPTDRSDCKRCEEMPEQKLVQDFQTRRKYTKTRKPPGNVSRDKTVLELGLSGTKYRFGGMRQDSIEPDRSETGGTGDKDVLRNGSSEDKMFSSSRFALPPISPRSSWSENTTPCPPGFNSLLNSDFGFKNQSSDTFSGIYAIKRTTVPSELEKELKLHAKRHIYACHNLGSIRKGSRTAQNVLGLKQTMSNGLRNKGTPRDLDHTDKSKSAQRKKPSFVSHKFHPSLTQMLPKPSVRPEDGLPVINGNSVFNSDA